MSSQYTLHRSLRHLHCLGNVRYCRPRCFHPNDLPSLADSTFPHDEVKLTGHNKLTFGVAKVVMVSTLLFKDYMVIFTHFARHVTWYIYIILTIFQEATQCLTLWKISLENFCNNFFPGVYFWNRDLSQDFTCKIDRFPIYKFLLGHWCLSFHCALYCLYVANPSSR